MGRFDEQQRQQERDYLAGRMKGANIPTMAGQAGRKEWLDRQNHFTPTNYPSQPHWKPGTIIGGGGTPR